MSLLPTITEEYYPERIFDKFVQLQGHDDIPEILELMAHYEPALKIYMELLEGNFKNGSIPALTKQMTFLAIINASGCRYCSAFVSHICQVAGVQEEMLQLLNDDLANLPNDLTGSVVKFGVKCALDNDNLSEEDYEILRGLGINNSNIMEIISLAASTNYIITLSETLKPS